MIKLIIGGAATVALLSGPAIAAPARTTPARTPSARAPAVRPAAAPTWVVIPTESGCRMDLELTARSGAVTPVSLTSDGQLLSLRFFKEDLPAPAQGFCCWLIRM